MYLLYSLSSFMNLLVDFYVHCSLLNVDFDPQYDECKLLEKFEKKKRLREAGVIQLL